MTEVIYHQRHGQPEDHFAQRVDQVEIGEHLNMPAKRRDSRGSPAQRVCRTSGRAGSRGHEIQAHAAHPESVHGFELGVGRRRVDDRDAAGHVAKPPERIDRACVVRAVGTRMDDHDTRNAEPAMQRRQVLHRSVARGIAPTRRERVAGGRAEDMRVAVACAGGHGEGGGRMRDPQDRSSISGHGQDQESVMNAGICRDDNVIDNDYPLKHTAFNIVKQTAKPWKLSFASTETARCWRSRQGCSRIWA